MVVSLSKGEHSTGTNWIQAIRLRRVSVDGNSIPVPLWAQVWELRPEYRERGDRQWWGVGFENPETPIISPDEAEAYETQHNELVELHASRRLTTELEEEEEATVESNKF
jgi:hypothetical protein